MRKKQNGFSLIELLIVVAIILIIAAIAVPNLLRSKMAANQASAVASLRTLNTSSALFYTNFNVYPTAIANMGTAASVTSTSADLIDSVIVTGTKSGYTFVWGAGGTTGGYTIKANPVSATTGVVSYFTDQSFVIRSNATTTANVNDLPIGN